MARHAIVVKKGVFDSAHRNTGFGEGHKCNRVHGHTFNYEVHVKSEINEDTGLSIDFGLVKQAMKTTVDEVLDHYYLNEDVKFFREVPPSAENIAYFIMASVQDYLDNQHLLELSDVTGTVVKVVLHETPTSAIIVTPELVYEA